MAFPAEGFEALYRNSLRDTMKFLEHRHKDNYWIFNFCPLSENSYDGTNFSGRVSRYPFPDHCPPPLAILPLATREIQTWLEGSKDRVAALHCKAGRGRSGTVACAYLLSLNISDLQPPRLQRSYTTKQWARLCAEEYIDVLNNPVDDMTSAMIPDSPSANKPPAASIEPAGSPMSGLECSGSPTSPSHQLDDGLLPSTSSAAESSGRPAAARPTLDSVLEFHTSRRIKPPPRRSSTTKKSESPSSLLKEYIKKQGITIPSQRRFLLYWSLILSQSAPSYFWAANPLGRRRPKIKLVQIVVRLRSTGKAKMTILNAVNTILDKTVTAKRSNRTYGQGTGGLWVSLSRYDDKLVDELESWEKRTRSSSQGHISGRERQQLEKDIVVTSSDGKRVADILFTDGDWDKGKMVKSFARLGGRIEKKVEEGDNTEKSRIYTHVLTPLDRSKWNLVQKSTRSSPPVSYTEIPTTIEDDPSFNDAAEVTMGDEGVILDASREVRAKLYLGQVFMGWFWFIPAFHMPQPPSSSSTSNSEASVHWRLEPNDIDFLLGIGNWIVDIDVEMAWVPLNDDGSGVSH